MGRRRGEVEDDVEERELRKEGACGLAELEQLVVLKGREMAIWVG